MRGSFDCLDSGQIQFFLKKIDTAEYIFNLFISTIYKIMNNETSYRQFDFPDRCGVYIFFSNS